MIPYDDLVAALASWRARQGLSVAPTPGAPPAQGRAPVAAMRAAPPAAPPRAAGVARPGSSGINDFDEGSLVEESAYEAVHGGPGGEATMIGAASELATDGFSTPQRGKRPDGW